MARFDPARAAARLARAAAGAKLGERAKQAAATLRAEYDAGTRGDEAPPARLWGTPKEQLDAVLRLLRDEQPAAPSPDEDATQLAGAMRQVDWAAVRAATAERGSDAAAAMRTLAGQVDWAKVQPVAAQVSSALIAAVASGRIPVGGPLGATVARTLIGQADIAQRVAGHLQREDEPLPPDFRGAIEVTGREL